MLVFAEYGAQVAGNAVEHGANARAEAHGLELAEGALEAFVERRRLAGGPVDVAVPGQQALFAEDAEGAADPVAVALAHARADHESALVREGRVEEAKLAESLQGAGKIDVPDVVPCGQEAFRVEVGVVLDLGPRFGEPAGQLARRLLFGDEAGVLLAVGLDEGGQLDLVVLALADHHGGVADGRMGLEHGLDFAELDAVAVHLDLRVAPAEELERAVGAVARCVAGAVHGRTPAGRRQKGCPGLLLVVPIAQGQSAARNVEVARHEVGTILHPAVENAEALVGKRPAVGHGGKSRIRRAGFVPVGPDGGFRRAAHGHDPEARHKLLQPAGQADGNPVAGEDHDAERQGRAAGLLGCVAEHLAEGGHGVPQRDAALADQAHPGFGIQGLGLAGHDDGAAGREHAEDVVDGEVEAQARDGKGAVAGADAVAGVDVEDGVHGRVVGDHDALGLAGGAGGVDHVGEIPGSGAGFRQLCALLRRLDGRDVDEGRSLAEVDGALEMRLAEDEGRAGILENLLDAGLGLVHVERQVGSAGPLDAEHGSDLLPALVHEDGRAVASPEALPAQKQRAGSGSGLQLAVAHGACRGDHGRRFGASGRVFKEGLVHQHARDVGLRGVDGLPDLRHGPGQLGQALGAPCPVVLGKPHQGLDVGLEHGIDHALGEEAEHVVEAEPELVVDLEELVVDPHLRRLGYAVHLASEGAEGEVAGRGLHGQGGGEDDRHDVGAAAAAAAHFPQHADAAEGAVLDVLPELAPDAAGPALEASALGQIDGEQAVRGELADDGIDLAVDRQAVEERQVQGELGLFAPLADGFGEGGEGDGRGRDAPGFALGLDLLPDLALDGRHLALEAGTGDLRRIDGQRKLGRLGQPVDALQPVVAVLEEVFRPAVALLGQTVVAEGDLEPGQLVLLAGVDLAKIVHHEADAVEVALDEVEAEVHAHEAARELGRFDAEVGPLVHGKYLVAQTLPDLEGVRFGLRGRGIAEVVPRDPVEADVLEHHLAHAVQNDRAQHGLALDEPVPGLLVAVEIQAVGLRFKIEVAGDAAERHAVLAAA